MSVCIRISYSQDPVEKAAIRFKSSNGNKIPHCVSLQAAQGRPAMVRLPVKTQPFVAPAQSILFDRLSSRVLQI